MITAHFRTNLTLMMTTTKPPSINIFITLSHVLNAKPDITMYFMVIFTSVTRGGRSGTPPPPDSKSKKFVKKNQVVLVKLKLVFREYLRFARDFDFPVKNYSSFRPLVEIWTGLSG